MNRQAHLILFLSHWFERIHLIQNYFRISNFFMWFIMVWLHFQRSLYLIRCKFLPLLLVLIFYIEFRSNPLRLIMACHLYFMRIHSHTNHEKNLTHISIGFQLSESFSNDFLHFLKPINKRAFICVSVCGTERGRERWACARFST